MILMLRCKLKRIRQLLYLLTFCWGFRINGAEDLVPHTFIYLIVCLFGFFLFLPIVSHNICVDYIWMKTAEMMNVRLKNRGQDKQPFAGSDEQPVMQKIESEIK